MIINRLVSVKQLKNRCADYSVMIRTLTVPSDILLYYGNYFFNRLLKVKLGCVNHYTALGRLERAVSR